MSGSSVSLTGVVAERLDSVSSFQLTLTHVHSALSSHPASAITVSAQ